MQTILLQVSVKILRRQLASKANFFAHGQKTFASGLQAKKTLCKRFASGLQVGHKTVASGLSASKANANT